jgi:hypothetical protein
MKRWWLWSALAVAAPLVFSNPAAATGFGTLSNFDVVNDTPRPCHGFEIELEDIHVEDVPYTFGGPYLRYGTPDVLDTTEDPAHPRVLVRYRHWNGSEWEATAIAPANITPSGHDCYANGPIGNYQTSGCEHFGVSLNVNPTRTTYRWIVATDPNDINTAFTVDPQPINVPVPVWDVIPRAPAAGGGVDVRAEVEPPEEENHAQHGEPQWLKVFKIESELDLQPEDLVKLLLGGPDSILPDETEIETEWKLIQSKPGDAEDEEEDADVKEDPLDDGKHSVIRRYEFYRYTGPRDAENNEALPCIDDDQPVPEEDPIDDCGDLGAFVGAQNVAVDIDLTITEAILPMGEVGVPYVDFAVVVGGLPPYSIMVTDSAVPDGMTLNQSNGVLSGTPLVAGDFGFAISAEDAATDVVRGELDITIVPAVVIETQELPPAVAGECYFAAVTASGGMPPYTWDDIDRDLPGWAETTDNSDIDGCPDPADEGVSPIIFTVTDSLGGTSSRSLDLVVVLQPSVTPTEATPESTVAPTDTPVATETETPVPTSTPAATDTPPPTETPSPSPTADLCIGDCDAGSSVTVDELITLVNIALGETPASACAAGLRGGATVDVTLIIQAVNNALGGCGLG